MSYWKRIYGWKTRAGLPYVDWRRKVLEKFKSRCADCGSYKLVECHHIKDWENYPDLRFDVENGICLCIDCHSKMHGHMESYKNKKLAAYKSKIP